MGVRTCCGCHSLRTGSLIIGYVSLILGGLYLMVLLLVFLAVVGSEYYGTDNTILAVSLIIEMLALLLGIISDIFLLLGVYKMNRTLITVFIIITALRIGFAILCTVLCLLALNIFLAVGYVIGILLEIYFIIVVWSYKKQLAEQNVTGRENLYPYSNPYSNPYPNPYPN